MLLLGIRAGALHRLRDQGGKVGHDATSLNNLMQSARHKDQPSPKDFTVSSQQCEQLLCRRMAELQGPLSFSPCFG
jgi:hypothetical protein